MTRSLEELPDLAKTSELASFTDISSATFARWRAEGVGPRVTYLGRAVRYAKTDVREWLRSSAEKSA